MQACPGGQTGTNLFLHPHPSFLQTFFFNVFESPSELFDMPIFITVSFSKCRCCLLGRSGRCLGPSLCPPPQHSCFPSRHAAGPLPREGLG